MANEPNASGAVDAQASETPSLINLKIISPSVGVPTPLLYPDIPSTTTVGQLKQRLRGELTAANPSDVRLRLIHRGRVLDADETILLNVFGAQEVRQAFQRGLRRAAHWLTPGTYLHPRSSKAETKHYTSYFETRLLDRSHLDKHRRTCPTRQLSGLPRMPQFLTTTITTYSHTNMCLRHSLGRHSPRNRLLLHSSSWHSNTKPWSSG